MIPDGRPWPIDPIAADRRQPVPVPTGAPSPPALADHADRFAGPRRRDGAPVPATVDDRSRSPTRTATATALLLDRAAERGTAQRRRLRGPARRAGRGHQHRGDEPIVTELPVVHRRRRPPPRTPVDRPPCRRHGSGRRPVGGRRRRARGCCSVIVVVVVVASLVVLDDLRRAPGPQPQLGRRSPAPAAARALSALRL